MGAPASIDHAEFERLYRRWWPDALSLCRRLLGADEAEDAAQEAFLRAWAARERYSALMPFWPWLAAIARRLCLDRRRRRSSALPLGEPLVVLGWGPEQAVVCDEELRAVAGVLEAMRPRERHVLVRRELDGWSYGRIAAVEGVSVEAVRSSLKRARACLRVLAGRRGARERRRTTSDPLPRPHA